MQRTLHAALVALLAAGVLSVAGATAAPGDVDLSFGTEGVASGSPGYFTRLFALARQPDGRLVVAGSLWRETGDVVLARFWSSGVLDTTFGVGGFVTTDLGGWELGWALALQPNGRIIVAARSGDDVTRRLHLVRYLPDGSLDAGFGAGGVVTTPIVGPVGLPDGLALQPDGKIVVAGTRDGSGSDIVRYTAGGDLDTSFGTDGTVASPFGGAAGYAFWYGVAVQPDRKIVVKANSGWGIELLRLLPNGAPDPMFGMWSSGHSEIRVPVTATGMLLEPSGNIVMAGLSVCGTRCDLGLVRVGTYGFLDSSFGTGGVVTTDLGGIEAAYGVARQANGKLVVTGGRRPGSPGDSDFVVARYLGRGALDTTFGGDDGVIVTDLGGDDTSMAVVSLPNGKVVAAGDSFGGPPGLVLVRYLG